MQYIKIKEVMVEQIESGMLSPGQKLPAERKLAEMFDTTRVTLREALSLLESEAKIYREDRRGWFISPVPLRYDPNISTDFSAMAIEQNRQPSSQLLSVKSLMANKQAASMLCLPPFTDIYQLESVYCLEQRPVLFVRRYIKADRFPKLLEQDLSQPLGDLYQQLYQVSYDSTYYKIRSTSLFGDMASALRATPGAPAMLIERVNHDKEGVIDGEVAFWRHDAMSIESSCSNSPLSKTGLE